jgi:hypothetical protein
MAECPYCEYEGECSSVEAHISSRTDEAHKGKMGIECREEIEEFPGEATDEAADEAADEATDEAADEATDELSVEPVDRAGKELSGFSAGSALIVGSALVVVAVLVTGGSDGSSGEADEESNEGLGEWSS